AIVFACGGNVARRHSLKLKSQDVQRFRPLDRIFDAIEDLHSKLVDRVRQQRARAAHRHFGAQLRKPPNVGAGNAGVKDVATDTYAPAFQFAKAVAQRENVEQTLRRMLVGSITSVDDVRL